MNRCQSPYRWVILFITIVAYSIAFLQRMSPTIMANDIITDFAVSAAFMGVLASAYFYPYAFMQVPSGILADKFSARKLISASLLVTFGGTFIFAVAPNVYVAFIGRLLVGLGVSVILMPVYKVLANWFNPRVYVITMSAVTALAGGFGSMVAGSPLAWFVNVFGWRDVSMSLAFITLALGVLVFLILKDSPDVKQTTQNRLQLKNSTNAQSEIEKKAVSEKQLGVWGSIATVLRNGNYWVIAISFFVNGAIMFSFGGLWAGLYYVDVCGLSRQEMSNLLSYGSLLIIFTPILFATFAIKIQSRKAVLMIVNGSVLLLCLWLYLRNGVWSNTEVYIWGIAFPTVFFIASAIFFASVRDIFPKNISGTASGLLYTMPMIASAIYQPLVGYILDNMGFVNVLTVEMFVPVTTLYLVTGGLAFVATFALKTKNGQLI